MIRSKLARRKPKHPAEPADYVAAELFGAAAGARLRMDWLAWKQWLDMEVSDRAD